MRWKESCPLIKFFLYYVLSTVEPGKIEYKVTNKGIKISGRLTAWQYLNRFWFSERSGSEIMIIGSFLVPGRLELVINPEIKEKLKKEISAYIPYEEVSATGLERITNWVGKRLPGSG